MLSSARGQSLQVKELSLRDFLTEGNIATSSWPYVQAIREIAEKGVSGHFSQGQIPRLRNQILWAEDKSYGYLTTSAEQDRSLELLSSAIVGSFFTQREEPTAALYLPIDQLYRLFPQTSSIVSKIKLINESLIKLNLPDKYAVILSGFSEALFFNDTVLKDIPSQKAIESVEFIAENKRLFLFVLRQLPSLIFDAKGDLSCVLEKLAGTDRSIEDAKLLLATALLLQDVQRWQELWFSGPHSPKQGTNLYIVSSATFHDSMNRLNLNWGHGSMDYKCRATLGIIENPLFEQEQQRIFYDTQESGLTANRFFERVKPFL